MSSSILFNVQDENSHPYNTKHAKGKLEKQVPKRTILGQVNNCVYKTTAESKEVVPKNQLTFNLYHDSASKTNDTLKINNEAETTKQIQHYADKEKTSQGDKEERVNLKGAALKHDGGLKVFCKNESENSQPVHEELISKVEKEEETETATIDEMDISRSGSTLTVLNAVISDKEITDEIPSKKLSQNRKSAVKEKWDGFNDYRSDLLIYFRILETIQLPKPRFLDRQRDLNPTMRTILVDWLVEVSEEYKLHSQTLFLAVSLVDRFLSLMSVVKTKLQLLGTTSMFVAAKCEEVYPPELTEFVYITDDTYTTRQVAKMEYLILKVLQFKVTNPTVYSFVTLFVNALDLSDRECFLTMYLCELTLLEGDPYFKYIPSLISCAALAVARNSLDLYPWLDEFATLTGYKLSDLADCIEDLNATYDKFSSTSNQYKAVFNKYSSKKFMNVSSIKPVPLDVSEYLTFESSDPACPPQQEQILV